MDEFERLEAYNEEFDILDELMDEELEDEFSEELAHYGTPRHSGRYPWGSGDNPYQSSGNFRKHVFELRKQGWNDVAIAKSMDMNTAQLRNKLTSTYYEEKAAQQAMAVRLLDKQERRGKAHGPELERFQQSGQSHHAEAPKHQRAERGYSEEDRR